MSRLAAYFEETTRAMTGNTVYSPANGNDWKITDEGVASDFLQQQQMRMHASSDQTRVLASNIARRQIGLSTTSYSDLVR